MVDIEAQIRVRMGAISDPDRRLFVFPVRANWQPGQPVEAVKWAGAPQVQATFATSLFECWLPLTTAPGGSSPSILWHRTQGEGYCLVRLSWAQGRWSAVAAMISQSDGAAMGADPFLLMYGHTAANPGAEGLKSEKLRLGTLAEVALERLLASTRGVDMALAQGAAKAWRASRVAGAPPPPLSSPDNAQLMIAAMLAWGDIPRAERAGLNLLMGHPLPLAQEQLAPLLVCTRDIPSAPARPPHRAPNVSRAAPEPIGAVEPDASPTRELPPAPSTRAPKADPRHGAASKAPANEPQVEKAAPDPPMVAARPEEARAASTGAVQGGRAEIAAPKRSVEPAVVNLAEARGRREVRASASLRAIAAVGRTTSSQGRALRSSEQAVAPLQVRLLSAWGVLEPSKPCVVWGSVCGGDGRAALVEAVSLNMAESALSSERFPISMTPIGPATSCEVLLEDVERLRAGKPLVALSDFAGQCFEPAFELAGPAFDCAPMRNLWGQVGRRDSGVGVAGAGAMLVAPSESPCAPGLVARADGLVLVADVVEIARAPQAAREAMEAAVEAMTVARALDAPPLRCALVLAGLEGLDDAPLRSAIGEALGRLHARRAGGLTASILDDMALLGELAAEATGATWISAALQSCGVAGTPFVAPEARAGLGLWVHDLPLLWLMRACRVRLNLVKERPFGPYSRATEAI